MGTAEDIRFQCPHCSGKLRIPAKFAGRRVSCPNKACRQPIDVPPSLTDTEPRTVPPSRPAVTDRSAARPSPDAAEASGALPRAARRRPRRAWYVAGVAAVLVAVGIGGALLWPKGGGRPGEKGQGPPAGAKAAPVRFTVVERGLARSSRNRDSVLKTVKMTLDELQAWEKESSADEERSMHDEIYPEAAFKTVHTVQTPTGKVRSTSRHSSLAASEMTDDQIREWVEDGKGVEEGRSATLVRAGYIEIIWRGSSGQLLYTMRNTHETRTGRDRASVLATQGLGSEDELRAWVADEAAASEERSVVFARVGYSEGVSRGKLQIPPFGW